MSCSPESLQEIRILLQDLKSELAEVKLKCNRIEKEVLGINKEGEANKEALMENITLKHIVEEIAYDVKHLKEAEEERMRLNHTVEVEKPCNKKAAAGNAEKEMDDDDLSDCDSDILNEVRPLKDVIVSTMTEEVELIRAELETVKSARELVRGETLKGKSAAEVLDDLNESRWGLVFEMNNYLCVTLSGFQLWLFPGYGELYEPAVKIIPGGQSEAIKFHSKDNKNIAAVVSFTVGYSDIRVYICFSLSKVSPRLRTLITDKGMPINNDVIWNQFYVSKPRLEWKYSENISHCNWTVAQLKELFVKLKEIRVRTSLKAGFKSILTLDIGSVEPVPESIISIGARNIRSHLRFKENSKQTLTNLNETYSCAIEIGNGMGINLEDPFRYLKTGNHEKIPEVIRPLQVKSLNTMSKETPSEGILSYRIAATDLRLVIGFRIKKANNEFALGFFPITTLTDNSLMETLLQENEWQLRPDQVLAKAGNGTARIQRRNIIVEAVMTNETNAALDVSIWTF